MGYTNETTHYGIPLPLGTDKTTPMDYNTSMQEVDTALFGAKSDSDSALRKAQQVETGLSQTDENVSSLAGRITTLEGTSVTHGNAIQQNAQDIANVRADALDMIEAKDEGTAQVATVAVNAGQYFRYNDVLYMATQNIAVGATIVPNTNCRATNVGTELELINELLAVEKIADSEITIPSGSDGYIINPFAVKCGNIVTLGCTVLSGTQAVPFDGRTIVFPSRLKTTTDSGWYSVAGYGSNNDVEPAVLKGSSLVLPASNALRNTAIYTITYVISPYSA